jgi:hypothetical protein
MFQYLFSVVDRHRFDAYPDPTFHLMPIQIRIVPHVLHMMANQKFIITFIRSRCQSVSNILDSILNFLEKSIVLISLALHLVEMNTELDSQY